MIQLQVAELQVKRLNIHNEKRTSLEKIFRENRLLSARSIRALRGLAFQ